MLPFIQVTDSDSGQTKSSVDKNIMVVLDQADFWCADDVYCQFEIVLLCGYAKLRVGSGRRGGSKYICGKRGGWFSAPDQSGGKFASLQWRPPPLLRVLFLKAPYVNCCALYNVVSYCIQYIFLLCRLKINHVMELWNMHWFWGPFGASTSQ